MQTGVLLENPISSVLNELSQGRRMTYQIIAQGHDGIVIASDQSELKVPRAGEGEGAVNNMLTKILIDPSGRFAWCFAGAKPSLLAASYLERELERGLEGRDLKRVLRDCGDDGWANGAAGPSESTVVLVDGQTKTLLRATLAHKATMVSEMADGLCFAGQHFSKASFIPYRFYSKTMSVEQLAIMSTYSVLVAGKIDPLLIGGLDVVIYRDSVGRFEFANRESYTEQAKQIDSKMRELFLS